MIDFLFHMYYQQLILYLERIQKNIYNFLVTKPRLKLQKRKNTTLLYLGTQYI